MFITVEQEAKDRRKTDKMPKIKPCLVRLSVVHALDGASTVELEAEFVEKYYIKFRRTFILN